MSSYQSHNLEFDRIPNQNSLSRSGLKFKCSDIGLLKMRKSEKSTGLNCRRVQPIEASMVAKYRPLLASINNSKKRFSDSAVTHRNSSLKNKLYQRQKLQRGLELQQACNSPHNISTKKCSLPSGPHKSTPFVWSTYLKEINAEPVSPTAFHHVPFTVQVPQVSTPGGQHALPPGSFKPGQYLEGIDPHNERLFCVLSVVEVVGIRVKLHFTDYPEKYDFWTTVDSAFIFPVGWCAHNNRQLQPPKEYLDAASEPFNWTTYLTKIGAKAVSRYLFKVPWDCPLDSNPTHMFGIGLKLEAVDKRNPALACVATIKDSIGDYVLIHFDGWDSGFDQWAHISSELLHPVGYCEQQKQVLSIPSDWNNRRDGFSWKQYLKETNSKPVTKEAFEKAAKLSKPSREFFIHQRLEAVDRRCPSLIRVANIVENTPPGFLTIGFDGWSEKYNIRIEARSLDLFPVGFCHATGHPLQVPPGYDFDFEFNGAYLDSHSNSSTSSISIGTGNPFGGCPTPGCKGYGHIKGPRYYSHQRISGCPYADGNLKKDAIRAHERLSSNNILSSNSPVSVDSEIPDITLTNSLDSIFDQTNNSGQRLSPDSTVKNEFYAPCTSDPVVVKPNETFVSTPSNKDVYCPSSFALTSNYKAANLANFATVINSLFTTTSNSMSCFQMPLSLPNVSSTNLPLPLNLSIERNSGNEMELSDDKPSPKDQNAVRIELSNSLSSTSIQDSNPHYLNMDNAIVGIHHNTSPANESFLMGASVSDHQMDINSTQKDSIQLSNSTKLEYVQSNVKTTISSSPQVIDQSGDYNKTHLSNISTLPIKRKRGRPRKYTSHIVHSSASSSSSSVPTSSRSVVQFPASSFSHTIVPGRPSFTSVIATPQNGNSTPVSGCALPVSSISSNNLTINSNPTPTDFPMNNNTVTINSNNYNNITSLSSQYSDIVKEVVKSTVCNSATPSPCESVTTSACFSPTNLNAEVDSFRSINCDCFTSTTTSGAAINSNALLINHNDSAKVSFSTPATMTMTNSVKSQDPTQLTVESYPPNISMNNISTHTMATPPAISLVSQATVIAPPATHSLLDNSMATWCPDTVNGFVPLNTICVNNPLLNGRQFYNESSRANCFLQSFNLSLSPTTTAMITNTCTSNYISTSTGGITHNPCREVDLMSRLLPQAGAALHAAKVAGLPGPHSWSPSVVASFVATLPGCKQFSDKFIENEIDGAALLCLEQHDLMQILGMKLGPAVKVSSAIQTLRKSLLATPISELGLEHQTAMMAAASCFNNSLQTVYESSPFTPSTNAKPSVNGSTSIDGLSVSECT